MHGKAPPIAIVSLILGIIGMVWWLIPFEWIFGIGETSLTPRIPAWFVSVAALVLALVTRSQMTKGDPGWGTALAGLVLGIIGVALPLVLFAGCMCALSRISISCF